MANYTQHPRMAVINSVMRQDSLRRSLEDAYNAPIGSTKRLYAKAILNSMKKMSSKQDGQGGSPSVPTPVQSGWQTIDNPSLSPKSLPKVIPAPLPPAKTTGGQSMSTSEVTANTPMIQPTPLNRPGLAQVIPKIIGYPSETMGKILQFPEKGARGLIGAGIDTASFLVKNAPAAVLGESQETGRTYKPWSETMITKPSQYKTVSDIAYQKLETPTATPDATVPGTQAPTSAPIIPILPNGAFDPKGMTDTEIGAKGKQISDTLSAGLKTDSSGEQVPADPSVPGTGASTGQSLVGTEDDPDLQLGPEGYARKQMMELTGSATLFDMIQKKEDELSESMGLNQAKNQMERMNAANSTFTDRANEYMMKKDEYIASVDKQMEVLDQKRTTMGVLSPEAEKMFQNQKDYLTLLKGRQTDRYVDYLKMANAEFNADYNRAYTSYQNLKTEFDKKIAGTESDWKAMHDDLVSQFNFLNGQTERTININRGRVALIGETLALQKSFDESEGGTTDAGYVDWVANSDDEKVFKGANILSDDPSKFDMDPNNVVSKVKSLTKPGYAVKQYAQNAITILGTYMTPAKIQENKLDGGVSSATVISKLNSIADTFATDSDPAIRAEGIAFKSALAEKAADVMVANLDDQKSLVNMLKSLMAFKDSNSMDSNAKAKFDANNPLIPASVRDALWASHKANASAIAAVGEAFYAPNTKSIGKEPLPSLQGSVKDVIDPYIK